ncbi:fungal-specific transcription factor domain-containing protein [Emericellopsis atlantica]|uniref:Fungal-specific transcription factor domain-containing protein n=1 Tax=Emericellopsis atlantica TaxID=2614577 RepID=A0A9P7ZPD0_9HYPO|nr:fungal-specific transcription factor domain-containing protein [Emericellopsis atlantica]KAG9255730.1 fungal-specific transcription factor domain-containing protein [Emericellopsis atlantica]
MTDEESPAAAKRRMRRIPDDQRKRNAQSCDRCRKRRCKCVPAPDGNGCLSCQEHAVPCTFTAPRRKRFYGSVDELSDRYRCLEAIVKGAFPNDNTGTAAELHQLGQKLGIKMPDIADAARPKIKIEELVRQPGAGSTYSNAGGTPGTYSVASAAPSAASVTSETPNPLNRSSSEEPNIFLMHDLGGNEHYVGPSGTLNFLSRIRMLVNEEPSQQTRVPVMSAEGSQAGRPGSSYARQPANMIPGVNRTNDDDDQNGGGSVGKGSPRISVDNLPLDGPSPGSITAIARDFTRLPPTEMEEILKQFPPDDKLEALIASYFRVVHNDFPLFHRATFQDEFEIFVIQARRDAQTVTGKTRHGPLPDWGWIGCLHMMIVFGSISDPGIPDIDHTTLRRRSVTVARALLPQFISRCTLTNVRVLLLLSLFLHNYNERNAAWNLVGAATRIAFALGLHRSDMNSSFRPLEREIRKWVFGTLYTFEQFLASSLGRPGGLQELDVEIVPPREGFLEGSGGTDARLAALSLKLQAILAKTRLVDANRRKAELATPYVPSSSVDQVLGSLDEWMSKVSQLSEFRLPWIKSNTLDYPDSADSVDIEQLATSLQVKAKPHLRAVLLLHIQFHFVVLAATRALLLRDITLLRKGKPVPNAQADGLSKYSDRAVRSACQLVYIVILLDAFDILNGLSGLDVYYAYHASMIIILRLLRSVSDSTPVGSPQTDAQVAEQHICFSLRAIIDRIQAVMDRTPKAGAMKRFAKVVQAFTARLSCSTPASLLGGGTTELIGEPIVPLQQHAQHHQQQPPPQYQQQMGGIPQPQYAYGNIGGGIENMMPEQAQFGQMPPYEDTNMDGGFLGLFPSSTFGATDTDQGPVTQIPPNSMAPQSWLDMELLLGGYGVQS